MLWSGSPELCRVLWCIRNCNNDLSEEDNYEDDYNENAEADIIDDDYSDLTIVDEDELGDEN